MPGVHKPMAKTCAGNRRMVLAPARVPRLKLGANDLCTDALLRVLSFLDARETVQTCVLSKQWRDLWRNVHHINASSRAFDAKDGSYHDRQRWLFKRFVNRLLILRNPVTLHVFRLWYTIDEDTVDEDSEEASQWICHALLCNALSVAVVNLGRSLELNPAVLISQHLTSLHFYSVALKPGFFRQLQTGCKALERLILQNCYIGDIEIASQTLKFLSIGMECFFPLEQASLSLPNLIHLGLFKLRYAYPSTRIPLLKNMESLETAYIDVFEYGLRVHDIRQFFLGLSGVTTLKLYFGRTQLLGMNLPWCPKFNNLKFLSLLNWYLNANFNGLIAFLQNSPNLEHLTLDLNEKQHDKIPEGLMGCPENGSFTCERLKTVEIICSEDDPVLNSLMEFLLGSGISSNQILLKH